MSYFLQAHPRTSWQAADYKKKYELWTVFGGQPLRFSLVEFGRISGLPCGEFPDNYDPESHTVINAQDVPYWKELIGDDLQTTLADVFEMLKSSNDMPSWRKLRLALILIVDGVLIATHQTHRPIPKYVGMLEDIDSFLTFPWGR